MEIGEAGAARRWMIRVSLEVEVDGGCRGRCGRWWDAESMVEATGGAALMGILPVSSVDACWSIDSSRWIAGWPPIKAGRHYMHPGGVRIGVPETTRLGMKESEMKEIASFIKRVVVDRQEPAKVAKDVAEFRKQFQRVQYAFENAVKAYEYISLTGRK